MDEREVDHLTCRIDIPLVQASKSLRLLWKFYAKSEIKYQGFKVILHFESLGNPVVLHIVKVD